MSEDAQYEDVRGPQTVPTSAPNMRSTREVPSGEAEAVIATIVHRQIDNARTGGDHSPEPAPEVPIT